MVPPTGSNASGFGTLLKVAAFVVFVVGGISVAGVLGVCTVADSVSCTADVDDQSATPTEPMPSNGDGTSLDPDGSGSTDDGRATEDSADGSDDGRAKDDGADGPRDGGTEDDSADGTVDPDAEESGASPEQLRGPDPPPYPERTDKEWDSEIRFHGDPGVTTASGDGWNVSSEAVERFVAREVNDYRVENGLDRLEYSHALASVSREHSADMWERDYFAHENPDGERAWDRWGHGECRTWYGENLFQSWANAPLAGDGDYLRTAEALGQRTLEGWQQSPPHDEAMREPDWDAVGYGVYFAYSDDDDGSYEMIVTMNMCTYNENSKT